jgi:hypothetical protein
LDRHGALEYTGLYCMDAIEQLYFACLEREIGSTASPVNLNLGVEVFGFTGGIEIPNSNFTNFKSNVLLPNTYKDPAKSLRIFGETYDFSTDEVTLIMGERNVKKVGPNHYYQSNLFDLLLTLAKNKIGITFGEGTDFNYASYEFMVPILHYVVTTLNGVLQNNFYKEATKVDENKENMYFLETMISLDKDYIEYVDIGQLNIYGVDIVVFYVKLPEIMLDELSSEKRQEIIDGLFKISNNVNPYTAVFLNFEEPLILTGGIDRITPSDMGSIDFGGLN